MGSYVATTAELARLSKIAGIKARREPLTESSVTANGNNLVLVQDSRSSPQRVVAANFIIDNPAGWYGWQKMEVGSEDVYWNSISNITDTGAAA